MKTLAALVVAGALVLTGCVCPHGPHGGDGYAAGGSNVAVSPAPHYSHAPGAAHTGGHGPEHHAQAHGNAHSDGAPGHNGHRPEHKQGNQGTVLVITKSIL